MVDKNEILFWKVFRNKYLKKFILDRLFTGKHALRFYDVFNIKLMIDDGQVELLKDKVKNNQYLIGFDETLFSFIKDDKEFYLNFFKNYPELYSPPNQLESKINKILIYDCIGALKLLIEEYNYKPTPSLILKSLNLLSYKSFKYMMYHLNANNNNSNNKLQQQQQQQQQKEEITIPFKVEEFWEIKFKLPQCFYKFSIFMIDKYKVKPCYVITNNIKKQYFGICPLGSSRMLVKDLKNACILIIQLGFTKSSSNLIFENQNEIKEISIKILTKFERNQLLFDFIYNQINNKSQKEVKECSGNEKINFILKLLDFYYQYSSLEGISAFYGLLLLKDNKIQQEDFNQLLFKNEKTDLIFSLRFGNFDLFKISYSTFEKYREEITQNWRFLILFQFEKNKANQISFIDKVCNFSIYSQNEKFIDFGFNNFLFGQVLLFDDLELVQLVYNKFGKPKFKDEVNYQTYEPWSIFYYIKSKKVLEFIVNDCLKEKTKTLPIMDFIINDRLDLIETYKSLLPAKSIPLKFQSTLPQYYLAPDLVRSLLRGIMSFVESPISNECGFDNKKGIIFYETYFNNLLNVSSTFSKITKFKDRLGSDVKEIVIPISQKSIFNKGHFRIIFSRWLFYNKPRYFLSDQALNGTGIFRGDINIFKEAFNTIEQPNNFINNFMNVYLPIDLKNSDDSSTTSNITINPLAIKEISISFIDWFNNVLINQAENGDIRLFKWLLENQYKQIFVSTYSIFSQQQILNILFGALNNGQIVLSKYLINEFNIPITSDQFESNVKYLSITYHSLFNNKNN
ncbi:hypothetical protein ACTFIR_002652 [Dictyostelium discoideum]